jgi:hypothetical protein
VEGYGMGCGEDDIKHGLQRICTSKDAEMSSIEGERTVITS